MATIKQRLAFKKVLNGSTLTKAMKEVGYAATTASTTGKLTNTKGWQELIDTHISEKALAKVHKRGLESFQVKFTPEGELIKFPDFGNQHKFMETGYKIRGKLKENDVAPNIQVNIFTDEQVKRIAARVLDGDAEGAREADKLPDSDKPEL